MNRLLVAALLAPLAACGSSQKIDTAQQMGPNPVLPQPSEELVAAVGVPKVVGWKNGETPVVPPGFKIEAMATGFDSPRNVYPLANGDVLVVETQRVGSEPVDRPKDPIRDFIMTVAHGGGGAKETAGAGGGPPQRITLLRDANGDGKPELTIAVDLALNQAVNPEGHDPARRTYQEKCDLCASGSMFIELRGDQFDISPPQPKPLVVHLIWP